MRVLSSTVIVMLIAVGLGASSWDQRIHENGARLATLESLARQDLQFEAFFDPNPVGSGLPTELFVTLVNQGIAVDADIYMVLIFPGGSLVSLVLSQGNIQLVGGLEPLLSSVLLPQGFQVNQLSLGAFSFLVSGHYSFVFGATRSGSLDVLGFNVTDLTVLGGGN